MCSWHASSAQPLLTILSFLDSNRIESLERNLLWSGRMPNINGKISQRTHVMIQNSSCNFPVGLVFQTIVNTPTSLPSIILFSEVGSLCFLLWWRWVPNRWEIVKSKYQRTVQFWKLKSFSVGDRHHVIDWSSVTEPCSMSGLSNHVLNQHGWDACHNAKALI